VPQAPESLVVEVLALLYPHRPFDEVVRGTSLELASKKIVSLHRRVRINIIIQLWIYI
jgi:hypothetical protein